MSGHIVRLCQSLETELIVLENDAAAHNHWVYRDRRDNERLLQETGYGGTSFSPAFEYIEEHRLNPSAIMVSTDGWGETALTPDITPPTLWCIPADKGPLSIQNPPANHQVLTLPPTTMEG